MPELPEVERLVRKLRPSMERARFERVIVRRRRLRTPLPPSFAARLEETTVQALRRRGKYLVADLSGGGTLLMHLGMSGSFEVHRERPVVFTKHDHVAFQMSNGATVVFNDPRRFGSMWLQDDGAQEGPTKALGPEPLDHGFGEDVLAAAFRRRRAPLKAALSDQRIVAGLGNIYVSEALHRARLSPLRPARTLTSPAGVARPTLRELVRAIRDTLNHALVRGDDDSDARFRVYDREGERCLRRGCRGTIKRIVQAGRSTFFCPSCQR